MKNLEFMKNEFAEYSRYSIRFPDTSLRKALLPDRRVLDHRNDGRSSLEWRFIGAITHELHRTRDSVVNDETIELFLLQYKNLNKNKNEKKVLS